MKNCLLGINRKPNSGKLAPAYLTNDAVAILYHIPQMDGVVATRVICLTPFAGCAVRFKTEVVFFPRIFGWRNWRGRGHIAVFERDMERNEVQERNEARSVGELKEFVTRPARL